MVPKALKSCPKSNKLPNLVALVVSTIMQSLIEGARKFSVLLVRVEIKKPERTIVDQIVADIGRLERIGTLGLDRSIVQDQCSVSWILEK